MPRVGFNPFRPHRANAIDIALVIGVVVVAIALVLWAALG